MSRTRGRTLLLGAAAAILGPLLVLLGLYRWGLQLAGPRPSPPRELLPEAEAAHVFAEHDWQDRVALAPLGPGDIVGVLWCETLSPIRDPRPCRARRPGTLAASNAASRHLAETRPPGWRRDLATGALAAWITRSWTAEELAAYLAAGIAQPPAQSSEPEGAPPSVEDRGGEAGRNLPERGPSARTRHDGGPP